MVANIAISDTVKIRKPCEDLPPCNHPTRLRPRPDVVMVGTSLEHDVAPTLQPPPQHAVDNAPEVAGLLYSVLE
ncbi:hypothetical protein [Streptomyces cinnamoneus]|uniref:hypothetical protein n=1 Tax=Streptomyces cinnamoneus TaxID=53446 RepID=UPI0037AA4173